MTDWATRQKAVDAMFSVKGAPTVGTPPPPARGAPPRPPKARRGEVLILPFVKRKMVQRESGDG